MSRPRQLPTNGDRIHVVFPKGLARRLRLLATHLGQPVSNLIQEMVEDRLPSKESQVGFPVRNEPLRAVLVQGFDPMPDTWTGSDLRQRLYALNRTQKQLVEATGIPQQTLNRWVFRGLVPPERRLEIRNVLEGWMANRTGQDTPHPSEEDGSIGLGPL